MLFPLLVSVFLGFQPDVFSLRAAAVTAPITLDGRLDERDWQQAQPATGFQQVEPTEGAAASQRTEVRVLYGESALYVGARLFDAEPQRIERALGRRDELNRADWFTVALDSYRDRRTAFVFGVNAAGVQLDGMIIGSEDDTSWDAIWASAVATDSSGWSVELRIPYSMLRFSNEPVQTWGVNFRRIIPRTGETLEWALVREEDQARGYVAQFGVLEGLRDLNPRRNVQITPYVVVGAEHDETRRALTDPYTSYDVGADARIGLASNVTLDLTVNPDFGQVESDPAELNLGAFETVLDERRPFFVEGLEVFQLSDQEGSVLYTRRIGARAPIISAAKVTGRTAGGFSFGALSAVTGQDFDPSHVYAAVRARQAFREHSRVGVISTLYDASLDAGRPHRTVVALGDWDVRLLGNSHAVTGKAGLSHRHAAGVETATGFAANASVARISGPWQWSLGGQIMDDDYDLNDAGRLQRNNLFGFSGRLNHQILGGRPFGPFQRASTRLFVGNTVSYRERYDQGLGGLVALNLVTRRQQSLEFDVFADYVFGGYNLYDTRGRGARAMPVETRLSASYGTDARRTWRLWPEATFEFKSDGSRITSVEIDGEATVSSRVQIGAEIALEREDGHTAWAANEPLRRNGDVWQIGPSNRAPVGLQDDDFAAFDDGGTLGALLARATPSADGAYYLPVYGRRDGRAFDASVRGTATFTPNLSLQLFAQLFAARGRYRQFQLLTSPDDLPDFDAYPRQRAYQLTSVQFNAVLRWQYRPGSTLFVVWTQARNQDRFQQDFDPSAASLYDVTTRRQLTDAFALFPANVLLLKLTYTFLS